MQTSGGLGRRYICASEQFVCCERTRKLHHVCGNARAAWPPSLNCRRTVDIKLTGQGRFSEQNGIQLLGSEDRDEAAD